jgi:hypothetical protein
VISVYSGSKWKELVKTTVGDRRYQGLEKGKRGPGVLRKKRKRAWILTVWLW